jgi:hypothetical protein
MAREMLKLRKGDSAIMIKADGSMQMAGINDKPLIDEKGRLSPIILFAAAWAKKDQATMNVLLENFKAAVREGYFGQDAQNDFMKMQTNASSAATTMETNASSAATTMETPKAVGFNEDKTKYTDEHGVEFEVSETIEESEKRRKEEENMKNMIAAAKAQEADPVFQRQRAALREGATIVNTGPVTQHFEPDLPVEQTMAYIKATPDEKKKMKEEEANKKEEPIVGNVTIEEEIGNENK